MQLLSPILIAISLWYVRFSRYGVFVCGHWTRTYIYISAFSASLRGIVCYGVFVCWHRTRTYIEHINVGAGPVPAHQQAIAYIFPLIANKHIYFFMGSYVFM